MIPDKAVEAAAAAIQVRLARNIGLNDLARAILEAGAPHIRAQALRDAAMTFGECEPEGSYSSTPSEVIQWLREYADANDQQHDPARTSDTPKTSSAEQ